MLGAAQQVSGSAFYVEASDLRLLVDLGLRYPENMALSYDEDRRQTDSLNAELPISSEEVEAIILTHAHLDHVGRVPLMFFSGYRGPIYSTALTRDLSAILFEMILRRADLGVESFRYSATGESPVVHSQTDCGAAQRIQASRTLAVRRSSLDGYQRRLCSQCRSIEVDQILELFEVHEYNTPFRLSGSVTAEFFDAKHIPGSASVFLTLEDGPKAHTLLFTGDIGSGVDSLLQGDPETPATSDFLFIETTYGAAARLPSHQPHKPFLNDLATAIADGKLVWIPAFALDRTQKVLHQIHRGQAHGLLPEIDIALTSSTAKRVNEIYDPHFEFRPATLNEAADYETSIMDLERPSILVTASYLDAMDMFHDTLRSLVSSPDVHIMMVGYQDPRSIGGNLIAADPGDTLRIADRQVTLNASVESYHAFSGHPDRSGILDYIERSNPQRAVVLKHGQADRMRELRPFIEERVAVPVLIPANGDIIPVTGSLDKSLPSGPSPQ